MRNRKFWCLLITLALLLQTLQTVHPYDHAHAEEEQGLIRGTFRYAGMYSKQKDSELDYVYSDAYFVDDAHVYNPSLSTMSLALEMSSWSSLDEDNWVNKSANAHDLLSDIGFVDYAQNDFWNDAPTVESIGVVAAHKRLDDSTLIALAVRGGGYFSEWGSNVLVGAADEHTGFATARDNVLIFLNDYIADCGITGRVKLWLVGFSRGGAVANMTAGYLNDHGLTADAGLVPADLYCYTFEAPQGVMEEHAGEDTDYGNIHNIINPNDIVPLVAPDDWGFSRYNQTSHLLPSITTTHYAQVREQMLKHYADILEGVEALDSEKAAYNIAEYAKTLEMKINWLSFLPGGDPFIEIQMVDNTHLPQSMMLVESVSALVEAAKSRERFHADIESDISTLLGEMLGANKGSTLSDYIQTLGAALTENDYANLIHTLEPIVQLNLKPFEERMGEVAARLKEIIPQPEGYTDIVGTVGSLVEVIATMLVEDPQAVLNLVLSLSNTNLIQAHYAEVTMAWLRTEDPNFTDTPFIASVPEALRIVRVNCPVDLMVYDKDGSLVASIINGVATSSVEGLGCAVNPDGEMVLYLPADALFDVQIIASGDGSVNCSINEFNIVRGKHTYVVSYADVPIRTGDVLTAVIPPLSGDHLTDPSASGSGADYLLLGSNGDPLEPDSILRGDQVNMYTVQAERNNEFGQVLGGGSYVENSFAQLTAYPVNSGSFIGWFKDGQQISTDTTYRFPVTGDVTIVAHFAPADSYQVTFSAEEGGTVHNISAAYPAGSILFLSASPAEGYLFDGWSASAGEIQHSGEDSSYLIVPECNTHVTASFVPAGEICPGCHKTLPKGKNHQAPCERIGHYTCKPGYSAYAHRVCPVCGDGYDCLIGHGYRPGECGMFVCGGCGVEIRITESHLAPCGTAGHWTCVADYDAAKHTACAHCAGHLCSGDDHGTCTLCGRALCNGDRHGTKAGECGYIEPTPTPVPTSTPVPAPTLTPAPKCIACGNELSDGILHLGGCGVHYSCQEDYSALTHSQCPVCGNLLCNGDDHGTCTICGSGHVCEGGHGTGSGECGVYACAGCGAEILLAASHAAPCGTAGHWTCAADYDAANHGECPVCGDTFCGTGNHDICSICESTYCNGMEHGTAHGQCGNLNTSALITCLKCGVSHAPFDKHLGDCDLHYTCQTGTIPDDHASCYACGGYMCDGQNHEDCELCGTPLCDGTSHGTDEGQCSAGAPDTSAAVRMNPELTAASSRTNHMIPGLAIAGLAALIPLRRRKKQM